MTVPHVGTIDGLVAPVPGDGPAPEPVAPKGHSAKAIKRDPQEDVDVLPYLPILRVLAKSLSDDNLTKQFTSFEAEFVSGLVRIVASCKCSKLSGEQARLLMGIYAKIILINELPPILRGRPEK